MDDPLEHHCSRPVWLYFQQVTQRDLRKFRTSELGAGKPKQKLYLRVVRKLLLCFDRFRDRKALSTCCSVGPDCAYRLEIRKKMIWNFFMLR